MGCNDFGLDPSTPPTPPTINMGSDFTIDFFLRDQTLSPWQSIDITSATEIVVIMLNADGTFLELKLSVSQIMIINGADGHFQAAGTAAQSALLKPSGANVIPVGAPLYSDIEAHVTISSKETIVLFPQSINLVPRLFPTAS